MLDGQREYTLHSSYWADQSSIIHGATFAQLTDVLATAQPDAHAVVWLPTERALAQSLRVQGSTVRERLASLEALGFDPARGMAKLWGNWRSPGCCASQHPR